MKQFILEKRISFDELDFLYECGMPVGIIDRGLLDKNDTGWCDGTTGDGIVSPSMRAIFYVETLEQELMLMLRYAENELLLYNGGD